MGVCTITQDVSACSIATVNPYRYRGYYYDDEIEMYYLQSRYYSPEMGRWLNGDVPKYLLNRYFVLEDNLTVYCFNNPVNMMDFDGREPISIGLFLLLFFAILVAGYYTFLVLSSPSFQQSWNNMCTALAQGISRELRFRADLLASCVNELSSRAKAREVINKVGIGYESPLNKISIKTGLHRRLHTNTYYGWANSVVISAYNSADSKKWKQKKNVISALGVLRAYIIVMNDLAPY